jgi:hypothetical protein
MIVNKDLPPDVFGAVNVESIHLGAPVDNDKQYKDVQLWSKDNLDVNGRYKGKPLHNYGFIYDVGDLIPVINRHSAMEIWNQAKKFKKIHLKSRKSANIKESNFVNKLKQKLKEKTNPDGTYSDDMEDAIRMKHAEGLNESETIYKDRQGGQDVYWMDNKDLGGKIHLKPEYVKKYIKKGYKLVDLKDANEINEMTTSSAAGGQAGGTISVPAWGTKNKDGSPKAIQATKKMKGWTVVKSISTEGK